MSLLGDDNTIDVYQVLAKTLSRPIFVMIAAISVYGYLYFYLTGRFKETVFLVLFSFLVFQVIRPRHAAVKKLVRHQKMLAEKGELLR